MKKRIFILTVILGLLVTKQQTYALDFMHEDDVYSMAQEICEPYHIAPEFVLAIIWKESRMATDVVSSNGKCVGLMQISQGSHKARMNKLGVTDLTNPYDNIRVGVDYLAELFETYEDDGLVLDYYNGNQNAQSNYDRGIVSKYASKILDKSFEYEQIYKEGGIKK